MCTIDWMAWAAWIGALSTLGLLLAAIYGFRVWKDQFFKQRDHDLALKLLLALEDSYHELDGLRSPKATIKDGDEPITKSSYDDDQLDWEFRKISARYLSRQRHCFNYANKRMDATHEALLVWDDLAANLSALTDILNDKERQVLAEAKKYVDNLHPNTDEEDAVDTAILYFPIDRDDADPLAGDAFATQYYDIVKQIRVLLKPKIRME